LIPVPYADLQISSIISHLKIDEKGKVATFLQIEAR